MHYVIRDQTNDFSYGSHDTLESAIAEIERRFIWQVGYVTRTVETQGGNIFLYGNNDSRINQYVKRYETLPPYRVLYVIDDSERFTLCDSLEDVVKAMLLFALTEDYPLGLSYLLHFACFQTYDSILGDYECTCCRQNELQSVWNKVIGR